MIQQYKLLTSYLLDINDYLILLLAQNNILLHGIFNAYYFITHQTKLFD
jgi:hypothetical protein